MENEFTKISLPKKVYNKIEEDVVNLYINYELDIPLYPNQVLKSLNYELHFFSEINKEMELNELICHDSSKKYGLSYRNPKKNSYEIWINDISADFEPRLNFTIMHEIGHIRLGHKSSSPLAEMEANNYASYALVPSPIPYWMGDYSFRGIAESFNVSIDTALIASDRVERWLEYGSPQPYEKLLKEYYENKRGD